MLPVSPATTNPSSSMPPVVERTNSENREARRDPDDLDNHKGFNEETSSARDNPQLLANESDAAQRKTIREVTNQATMIDERMGKELNLLVHQLEAEAQSWTRIEASFVSTFLAVSGVLSLGSIFWTRGVRPDFATTLPLWAFFDPLAAPNCPGRDRDHHRGDKRQFWS
jgi:hypothetical protein